MDDYCIEENIILDISEDVNLLMETFESYLRKYREFYVNIDLLS